MLALTRTDITVSGKAIYNKERRNREIISCEVEVHRKDNNDPIGEVEVSRHVPSGAKRVTRWTIEGTVKPPTSK